VPRRRGDLRISRDRLGFFPSGVFFSPRAAPVTRPAQDYPALYEEPDCYNHHPSLALPATVA
jgi:hypothetical protein